MSIQVTDPHVTAYRYELNLKIAKHLLRSFPEESPDHLNLLKPLEVIGE
jgi:hypothetical protein